MARWDHCCGFVPPPRAGTGQKRFSLHLLLHGRVSALLHKAATSVPPMPPCPLLWAGTGDRSHAPCPAVTTACPQRSESRTLRQEPGSSPCWAEPRAALSPLPGVTAGTVFSQQHSGHLPAATVPAWSKTDFSPSPSCFPSRESPRPSARCREHVLESREPGRFRCYPISFLMLSNTRCKRTQIWH